MGSKPMPPRKPRAGAKKPAAKKGMGFAAAAKAAGGGAKGAAIVAAAAQKASPAAKKANPNLKKVAAKGTTMTPGGKFAKGNAAGTPKKGGGKKK
jgi:hypothetical protein